VHDSSGFGAAKPPEAAIRSDACVPPPHSTSSSPPPGGDVIAAAVIAVIYLCCSGLTITLPTEDEENQFHSTHDTAWVVVGEGWRDRARRPG
jgi:hypothetical protein